MAKSRELVCVLLNERDIMRADVFPENTMGIPTDQFRVVYYDQTAINLTTSELLAVLSDRQLQKQTDRLELWGEDEEGGRFLEREAKSIGEVIKWLEEIDNGE